MKRGRKKRVFDVERIRFLYESGESTNSIGRKLGAYHEQIRKTMKEAGIARRSRSESLKLYYSNKGRKRQ